jgi:hypothetical protein
VTNAGLFDAASGGNLFLKGDFTGIGLASGDSHPIHYQGDFRQLVSGHWSKLQMDGAQTDPFRTSLRGLWGVVSTPAGIFALLLSELQWSFHQGEEAGVISVSRARRMEMSKRAWLAGLFDGEGSIIFVHKDRLTPSIRITITNTSLPLLERVQEVAGVGQIIVQRRAGQMNPKHSASWHWQTYSASAFHLLEQMLPWLIVKREKALLALERRHPDGLASGLRRQEDHVEGRRRPLAHHRLRGPRRRLPLPPA